MGSPRYGQLLNRCAVKSCTQGSNPCLSANPFRSLDFRFELKSGALLAGLGAAAREPRAGETIRFTFLQHGRCQARTGLPATTAVVDRF